MYQNLIVFLNKLMNSHGAERINEPLKAYNVLYEDIEGIIFGQFW